MGNSLGLYLANSLAWSGVGFLVGIGACDLVGTINEYIHKHRRGK